MSYLRSIHVQKDKSIFKLEELPVQKFAESLGLPGAPKIKFLSKEIAKRKKDASHAAAVAAAKPRSDDESEGGESDDDGLSDKSSDEEEEKQESTKTEKVSVCVFYCHCCC